MPFRALSPPYADFLPPLLDLCEGASAVIRREYESASAQPLREKADATPLTSADLASHRILSEGLVGLAPEVPILSEESSAAQVEARRSWRELWVVDPLDGTKEFLARTGQFTINIALVRDQRPVLGLIYEPLTREGSAGIVGEGAWRLRRENDAWVREDLATRPLNGAGITVLSSHRHRNERLSSTLDFLDRHFTVGRENSGSALKFCDLAAGRGDVYPRFSICSEWDVAAGDALVTAAGGAVLGLDGEPLAYNARETLISPHFLAVGDPSSSLWPRLLGMLA